MRRLALTIGLIVIVTTQNLSAQAASRESRFKRSLLKLEPTDRLVQLCDYTAMQRIGKDRRKFRPDRAVAGATAETKIEKDTLQAKGGAFRSRKKWYALSYTCKATSDRMTVVSFEYTIGSEIPEAKWASFGLW
jgi:hypothetical protein